MGALLLGLMLGGSAGITPGPLLAHVVRLTLVRGAAAGRRAACAPLVTDLPVAVLAVTVLGLLPSLAVYGLGGLGGCYLVWSGLSALRRPVPRLSMQSTDRDEPRTLLWRAALVNLISPHPWLFWSTVLGPLLLSTWRHSALAGGCLLVGFYLGLIGSKVILATAIGRAGGRLGVRGYSRAVHVADAMLVLVGTALIAEFLVAAVRS